MTAFLQPAAPPELEGTSGLSKQSANSSCIKSSSCSEDQGSSRYVEAHLNDSESWLTLPVVACLYMEIVGSL